MTATNLPAARTSFVGREAELASISDALRASRLVTVTGTGGVGKTRLALEVGRRTTGDWPDGVRLVELDATREPLAVVGAVASALGLAPGEDEATVQAIARRLEDRHMLLVLDNCEHVVAPIATIAQSFVGADSRSRVLATSRTPLSVAGEHVVQALPMSVPDAAAGDDTLTEFDSVRLFVDRALQADSGLLFTRPELHAVGELCAMLDGLPLAIEIAAGRVRAMAPTEIRSRLHDRLALTSREPGHVTRHRNLETTIRWSYDLLDVDEQDVFRRLAVFPAPFTLTAAERTVVRAGAAEAIVGLVDSSLLAVDDRSEVTRYRMLDAVREFGLRRLAEAGETATARRSYLQWAVDFVESESDAAETDEHAAALRRVVAEQRNLVGALATTEMIDERLRLAGGLASLLAAGTDLREIRRVLEAVLSDAREINTAVSRRTGYWLGHALRKLGDLDGARDQLAAIATAAVEAGDRDMASLVGAEQALLEMRMNRYAEARNCLEAEEAEERLHPQVLSFRMGIRAQLHWALDQLDDARRWYDASIALSRQHGRFANLVAVLAALAELAGEVGDVATAERCAREVLDITDPAAEVYPRNGAVLGLGLTALRANRPVEAASWLGEGAAWLIERGSVEAPIMVEKLALAVAACGDLVSAATLIGAASTLRDHAGVEPMKDEQATIEAAIAIVTEGLGEPEVDVCLGDGRHLHERDLLTLVRASSMMHSSR